MNRFRVVKALLLTFAVVAGLALVGKLTINRYGAYRLDTASRRFERDFGPLAVDTFVRPKVPAEVNAVTWQRPGVLAAVFLPGDSTVIGSLSAKPFSAWSAEETRQLEVILERNRPSIELLERARGVKASNWEIPYDQGATAKIPNLLAAINAAKMLAARGRLALGRGDRETAVASAETLGSLARSHEAEPATIVLLIGRAIETYQLAVIHELATSPGITTRELDRLEASLPDEDLTRAVRRSLRGQTAAIAHDLSFESTVAEIHGAIHQKLARVLSRVIAASLIDSHRDVEKRIGVPVRDPLPLLDATGGWWARLIDSYRVNSTAVAARATATASARDLARLALALRRAALATGRYPATLPKIGGVPTDDPLTGSPRVYEVHPNGSAELRSTTTKEIVRSIAPGSPHPYDAIYVWELPAPGPAS